MSEQEPRESAKDKLDRATDGLVVNTLIKPGEDGYRSLPEETRPLAEQEPVVLFRHPDQSNRIYRHRLRGAGENAFLEVMGISRGRTYNRERTHEAYQAGYEKGYEAGRQWANDEITRLNEELDDARQQIAQLQTQVEDLTSQLQNLTQELSELRAMVAANGNQATEPGAGEPAPTSS